MPGEVTKAKLDGLKAGINDLLVKVNTLLAAEAYAENLPIIGAKLANATPALETLTKLSAALQTAVDTVSSLQNLSTMTTAEVAQALTDALAPQINDLRSAANKYLGTVGATVDASGNIVLTVDMGRTIDVGFTLGDLGMSGLGLALTGQGNAQLAYNLDFRIGADASGFWFDPAGSNLSIGTKVDLNGLSASGNLGILHFAVSNIEDNDPASDADTLKFDITSTWNGSGLVRSFNTDLIDFKASGDVDLDLKLQGDLSNAALPSISAEFHVDWNFNQSLLNGGGANSWSPATVGFTNVRYDFGNFVETTIRPVVEKLTPILGPVNEALAILNTDFTGAIPQDWRSALEVNGDGKITLLDFIQKAASFAGQNIDTAPIVALIDTIKQVVDLANLLSGKSFSNDPYQIGDYSTTFSQIQGAADALSKIDVSTVGSFTSSAPSLGSFLNGLAASNSGGFGAGASGGGTVASQLGSLISNATLSFPVIENPLSVIKLLIGQNADIFKFDMPAINLGIGMDANGRITNPLTAFVFPVWPIPYVDVRVNVALQLVADLAFGYDTSGLRYWIGQGANLANIADVFTHGFYLNDQRSGTTDVPEFVLRAAVEAGLTSSVGVVTIGGGANITGEIVLDIANALTNAEGKLYLSQIPAVALSNPFALFDVSGSVEAGARFWVDWPFGNIFNVSTPGVELLSFDGKADASALGLSAYGNAAPTPPPPPGLADVIAGGLWLAVGPRAGERDITNTLDTGEQLRITGSGSSLTVTGFGASQTFSTADFASIQADGATGNDTIVIAPGVSTPARMSGGEGNDYLQGGDGGDQLYGGVLDDYLVGGAGADTLDGEDGNDRLEGGAGGDTLRGGAGLDTATYVNSAGITLNLTTPSLSTGDAAGDTFDGIEIFEGSNAADTMIGSAGADIFTALDGNDTLQGMGGDDTLAPGKGTNSVDGGDGFDIVNYYNIPVGVTVVGQAGGGYRVTAGTIVDDTLVNVEQIDGSANADTMTGSDANDIFVGREGDDTLDGGAGDDTLVGGEGRDTLRGGAGDRDRASYILSATGLTVSLLNPNQNTGEAIGDSYDGIEGLRGSEYNDILSGDGGANLLQGGAGDDVLNGNAGADTLQGGIGADTLNGGDGRDIASYYGSTGKVTLDLLNRARDEGEAVGDSFSSIEVYQGTRFSDTISGSNDGEELWGEEGNDTLSGMGGIDTLLGGAGDDTLDGGAGNDILSGGADADTLYGGIGNDTLDGDDGSDRLYGGDDDDTISGGAGEDFLYGDGGDDVLSGGVGADRIDGGTGKDRVTYDDGAAGGVRLNLSSTGRTLGGVAVAAFSAVDTGGAIDTFGATGALADVEDATGSARADWIVANEGGSTIDSLGGDDTLIGLGGGDTLAGGNGDDVIDAGGGDDTVLGGAGTNDLKGGDGTDWVSFADIGGSVVASLTTNTAVKSLGGTDTLAGFENLRGSAGSDTLTGDTEANRIEGLGGNDTLDGGGGADVLVGGLGDDIYFVDNASGDPTQASDDTIIEEGGSDLVKSRVNYTLASNLEDLQLLGTATTGTGNASANLLIGNALNNVLDGRGGSDTFWGYGGDDTYYFDDLGDAVGTANANRSGIAGAGEVAGGGIDTIKLATANIVGRDQNGNPVVWTYSLGGVGLDQVENLDLIDNVRRVDLTGNALGNRLTGNSWNQILRGEGGDDTLDPGTGKDTVIGGTGHDTLRFDWSAVTWFNLDISSLSGSVTNDYNGELYNRYQASDSYLITFSEIERFDAKLTQGDDTFNTGDGNDIVFGNDGNDTLSTGKGFDIIDGGTGTDRWLADKSAASAAMTIDLAVSSTYAIAGGTGSIVGIEALGFSNTTDGLFKTGDFNDVVTTRNLFLHDYIATNGGNDRVIVFGGKDAVHMGDGYDTLVIDWSGIGYAIDISGLAGSLAAGYYGDIYNRYQGSDTNLVNFSGVEDFDVRLGSGDDTLNLGDGNDIVSAGAGNDTLSTGKGYDVVDGGDGTDRWLADKSLASGAMIIDLAATSTYAIAGGTGSVVGIEALGFSNDAGRRFETGAFADVVTTRNLFLNDYISTNGGDDRVLLYGGKDVALMGDGYDTLVIDWSGIGYAIDVSGLSGSLAAGYYGDIYNRYQGSDTNLVTFSGVEDFHVRLGSGDDTLNVGDGDDIVYAGAGNDTLSTALGIDIVDGGAGTDRWLADKSAATAGMTIDLTRSTASTYQIGARTGSVTGIEVLGVSNVTANLFKTGSGNDIVVTRTEFLNDFLSTGAGDDTVTIGGGKDAVHMGAGFDTLIIDWTSNPLGYDVFSITGNLTDGYSGDFYNRYQGSDTNALNFSGVERFDITTGDNVDIINTGDADDRIRTGGGNDTINAAKGADVIDGGAGTDRLMADKSAATIGMTIDLRDGAVSSYVIGDVTATIRGIETLGFGNSNDGLFRTGSGNDTVVTRGEFLNDFVSTGAGDDTVTIRGGKDAVHMGDGFDTLIVDWTGNPLGYDVFSISGSLATGYSGDFYNRYQGGDTNALNFWGVERFDITTGDRTDVVNTGDADDRIRTGGGDDTINAGKGADVIDAGSGVDRLMADKSAATAGMTIDLRDGAVSSYVIGGVTATIQGVETLGFGNTNGSLFQTGSGNDVVITRGEFYNDYVGTGDGDDIVTVRGGKDAVHMGAGFDTLVVDWSTSAIAYDIFSISGSLAAGYSGDFYNRYQSGDSNFVNFSGVERFDVTSGSEADYLRGGDGNDRLRGMGGNDTIDGYGGDDVIDGGTGSDTMRGGAGDDTYTVDAIGDVVVELTGEGIDTVQTTLAAYTLGANIENLTGISATGGQVLTGNATDNIVLGSAFGDILDGGAGNDTLRGGTGDDFFVAGKGTNDQYFGDAGTDTVVVDGTLANWEFVALGDGRVRMTDLRDAASSVAFLTGIERVEIKGVGSWSLDAVLAGNSGAATPGTTGNDVVTTVAGGLTLLTQGGTDRAIGTAGTDTVLFGASFDPTDEYDGGAGLDEIGLQGNYTVTFGAGVVNVEALTLLSASDTRFGAPGTGAFSYNLTVNDANVAAGTTFLIQANSLLPGENLTFDGRPEADGSFLLYAGRGNDTVIGGKGVDGFYFGNGRFNALDRIDGFEGPDDQLGIRGDYSTLVELGPDTIRNISTFVLVSGTDARFGSTSILSTFNIKLHDANLAAGKTMTVQGNALTAAETVRFDGSSETDGNFLFIGGAGNDTFIGGAGADRFYGAAGVDTMTGGGGNDTYIYLRSANSTPTAQDTITDFQTGDCIDLSGFDAIPGGGRDVFALVNDFTGAAGQLRIRQDTTNPAIWFVESDTDGIGGADFSIKVISDHAITAADFIL